MLINQIVNGLSEAERNIHRLAGSLDSLILNGIQFGVYKIVAEGFLKKVSDGVLQDLQVLEDYATTQPIDSKREKWTALKDARTVLIKLIDLLDGLRTFRSFSIQELRAEVSRISNYRTDIVRLIEEIEESLQVARPFYKTRPQDSAKAIEAFVAYLPHLFETEWRLANADTQVVST